ncbi:MFS general substrate transporter [Thozetella sp. PMI_491]|nr:MFS general substrate transporter [Thozetella sp. PMI_491]
MAPNPELISSAAAAQDDDNFEKRDYLPPDVDDDEEYTLPEQRKIIHKVDRRLLVLLGLMQAVSFIDRANVSNAAVAGMTAELQLGVSNRYSIILLVFFAPFVAFQFPASILVRKIGPRLFLSGIVLSWGIVMIGFGFIHHWTSLIPLRAVLGAFESGAVPAQYYLISSWYSRYDLYVRTSIFYLIGVLGSAMTGVLGLGFSKMSGLSDISGWRWIFIMEGVITCCIGIAGFIFMVDFPEKAHRAWGFLTEREGAFIVRRINRDRQDAEPEAFSLGKFLRPALDLKVWGFALLFYCTTIQNYAVGFFLPVILHQKLGFSDSAAQGLSTPPYLTAMVLMFLEGYISDKIRLRFPMLYFNAAITITGLCVLVWAPTPGAQYFGAILATAGPSANLPSIMVFQANNIRGTWKRAFSSASLIACGGIGGITGSLVFRSQDAPQYLPGIYCCLTANGVILLATTSLVIYFTLRNRAAARGDIIIENLPGFRYAI